MTRTLSALLPSLLGLSAYLQSECPSQLSPGCEPWARGHDALLDLSCASPEREPRPPPIVTGWKYAVKGQTPL